MSEIRDICNWLADVSFDQLPSDVVSFLKDGVVDYLGVALMGYRISGGPLTAYARRNSQIEESTIIGDGSRVNCATAAAVNAQMAYDSDFDETGPGNHSFSLIAASGLAVAERQQSSGEEILATLAATYQLNGKFHRNLDRTRSNAGIRHLVATCALCAGKLIGFDAARLEHAVELAWMLAPIELDHVFNSRWWESIGQGNVQICQAGVNAALLAEEGVEGPLGLLSSEGLYDLENLVRANEPEPFYYVRREMHLKPWIGSRGTHGAIEAAKAIVEEEGLEVEEIEELTFLCRSLYLLAPFNAPLPRTQREALYSVQWTMASALCGQEPGLGWIDEAHLANERVRSLAHRIVLEEDPEATELWRSGRRFAPELRNTIHLRARGKSFSRSMLAATVLGGPERRMTRDQIVSKFKRLAIDVIGEKRARDIVSFIGSLEEKVKLDGLVALLSEWRT
jgi:2-methylcitrate dehydratase PrpD